MRTVSIESSVNVKSYKKSRQLKRRPPRIKQSKNRSDCKGRRKRRLRLRRSEPQQLKRRDREKRSNRERLRRLRDASRMPGNVRKRPGESRRRNRIRGLDTKEVCRATSGILPC